MNPVAVMEGVALNHRGRGTADVITSVDLTVTAGEVVGIGGPSGAGKTTLLRGLAGLLRPRGGRILHAGHDIWAGRRPPTLPRPGYVMPVFQDASASLDPRWPIWRTVAEPLTVHTGLDRRARRTRAGELLAAAGLTGIPLTVRPDQLSGGQRQRVAIARAVAARPALVVADEPTAQLDPTTAAGVTRLLRRLADDGTAVVVVSHDRDRLAVLADRLFTVSGGSLTPVADTAR